MDLQSRYLSPHRTGDWPSGANCVGGAFAPHPRLSSLPKKRGPRIKGPIVRHIGMHIAIGEVAVGRTANCIRRHHMR
jgi:hypothetical protein